MGKGKSIALVPWRKNGDAPLSLNQRKNSVRVAFKHRRQNMINTVTPILNCLEYLACVLNLVSDKVDSDHVLGH
jgi:hypothetical protein